MTEAPSGTITRSWARRPAAVPARTPRTPTAVPYDLVLDWRHRPVSPHPRPCRHCGRGAYLLDPEGQPCHKTCAEAHLVRTKGLAAAYAVARASYRPRATTRSRAGS